MDTVRECRQRQIKFLKLLKALEEDALLSGLDDDTVDRLKRRIGKSLCPLTAMMRAFRWSRP